MLDLVESERQQFGLDKRETLPRYCLECNVRFACHGGCPCRPVRATPTRAWAELPLSRLQDLLPPRRPADAAMGELLRHNRAPAEIMALYAAEDRARGRNDPCPCGGGRKWKSCHGLGS